MTSLAQELSLLEPEEALGGVLQDILVKIENQFNRAGVSLPDRKYIHIGATAHDCEQLTVSFQQLFLGAPGARADAPQICTAPRSTFINVQLVRRVILPGTRQAPSPAMMTERALERMKDASLLMDSVLQASDEYLGGVLVDVSVTDPQGEYQAIVLNVTAGIP